MSLTPIYKTLTRSPPTVESLCDFGYVHTLVFFHTVFPFVVGEVLFLNRSEPASYDGQRQANITEATTDNNALEVLKVGF
jgi:hypothetical protein